MFNNNYTIKPTRGLVASYPLDGNANAKVGTNGTATNVTWVKTDKGYQNQCGSFDSSSYIQATQPNINNTSRSYSVFVNLKGYSNYAGIVLLDNNSNIGFVGIATSTNGGLRLVEGGGESVINTDVLLLNTWYHIVLTYDYTTGIVKAWKNGSFLGLYNGTPGFNIPNSTFQIGMLETFYKINGLIQNVDIYNVALTEDEIRNLYLEGQRQLGNNGSYPSLLSGLVGYFRAEDIGGTSLYNLVNGITATRLGGTNTADNLGNNKAISNPNYTWSSLTYTAGYTFENSGSGWNIVTSPTGLSATGINRTTTLRDVFLFNRTLTANEITQLQDLCNKEIIYPSKVYDLPNLRDGLVLDLDSNGKDLSGNGNNGTLVNSPTLVRQGRAKGLSYNGSNQYANFGDILDIGTGSLSYSIRFNTTTSSVGTEIGLIGKSRANTNTGRYTTLFKYGNINTFVDVANLVIEIKVPETPYIDGKWHMLTVVIDRTSNLSLYLDGINKGNNSISAYSGVNFNTTDLFGIGAYLNSTGNAFTQLFFNGKIFNPKIRNRALSSKEIQQLYYSQKANFIY